MIKSKPLSEVKVGDTISLYETHYKESEVLSLSTTPSGKSIRIELSSGWKGCYRLNSPVFYKEEK